MEQELGQISKENECRPSEFSIEGSLFKHYITPFVEITLATGKINPQQMDPLLIVSPKGAFFIAKTVRQKNDGEGSVFFITDKIKSEVLSYICMDFDRYFLNFCRNVRKKDTVSVKFDREFSFRNTTRIKEDWIEGLKNLPEDPSKWVYYAGANSIDDIRKEVDYSLALMRDVPQKWTATLEIPAREVRKFYLNVWRYLHRAVFFHKVINNNALVASYSEDALRDLFSKKWEEAGFNKPLFETPKRRFFMARHFVDKEDGVKCSGEGHAVFRANWRVLNDISQAGPGFEFRFSDLKTPYGIIAKDSGNCFMQICENTFDSPEILAKDLNATLHSLANMDATVFCGSNKLISS